MSVRAQAQGPHEYCILLQGSYDAMDLGDLDNPDFALVRASLNYPNGASANGVNYAGMSKSFKDAELKRLDEEVCAMPLSPHRARSSESNRCTVL